MIRMEFAASARRGGFVKIIFLLKLCSVVDCSSRNLRNVYVEQGHSIVLQCVNQSTSTTWDGPNVPRNVNDINNLMFYSGNEQVNTQLANFDKISVVGNFTVGEYNLKIDNISTNEEGIYRSWILTTANTIKECYFLLRIKDIQEKNTLKKQEYSIIEIKRDIEQMTIQHYPKTTLPRNLIIWNTTKDGFVVGKENDPLDLICSVKSGVPQENITWFQNTKTKIRGGPGRLSYSFTPERSDNGNIYCCTAQNPDLKMPLKQSVILNITYSPSVTFDSNETITQITEGDNLELPCVSDGNPIPFSLTWSRNQTVLSNQNNQKVAWLVIQNISRHFTDNYTCEAKNAIGSGIRSTYLQVLYPPLVNVTCQTPCNTVICLPHGEPDNYSFSKWEHKSEFGDHIRFLDNSPNISILEPQTGFNGYRVTGLYICSASNGIRDWSRNMKQKGQFFVKPKGKPVFVTENENKQYARLGKDARIVVLVYSYPKYNNISITSTSEHFEMKAKQLHERKKVLSDTLNGVDIRLSGYEISLQMYSLDKNNLSKYKFQITNEVGSEIYTVELVLAQDERKTDTLLFILIGAAVLVLFVLSNVCNWYMQYRKRTQMERENVNPTDHAEENNVIQYGPYDEIDFQTDSNNSPDHSENSLIQYGPYDDMDVENATYLEVVNSISTTSINCLADSKRSITHEACGASLSIHSSTSTASSYNSALSREDSVGYMHPYNALHHDSHQIPQSTYTFLGRSTNRATNNSVGNTGIQYGPCDEIELQTCTYMYMNVVDSSLTNSTNCLAESQQAISHDV